MGKHSKHGPGSFLNPHAKRSWLPDLLGHQQGGERSVRGKKFQDELDERTRLIQEEILGKAQEPESKIDQEVQPGGSEKE